MPLSCNNLSVTFGNTAIWGGAMRLAIAGPIIVLPLLIGCSYNAGLRLCRPSGDPPPCLTPSLRAGGYWGCCSCTLQCMYTSFTICDQCRRSTMRSYSRDWCKKTEAAMAEKLCCAEHGWCNELSVEPSLALQVIQQLMRRYELAEYVRMPSQTQNPPQI